MLLWGHLLVLSAAVNRASIYEFKKLDLGGQKVEFGGMNAKFRPIFLIIVGLLVAGGHPVQADVMNYTRFVAPGKFALGVEPQLTLTSGAGLGVSARYTQGINDLMNASLNLGNGSGPRQARIGGAVTFDFFPDLDKQPGIGLTVQTDYVRAPVIDRPADSTAVASQVELLLIPYIHKGVTWQQNEVDPFFALPLGLVFQDGLYRTKSTFVIGALFKITDPIRTSVEAGLGATHSDSYLSGGLTYYY